MKAESIKIMDLAVQRDRRNVILLVGFGVLGSVVNMFSIPVVPLASLFDVVSQGLITLALVTLAAWLLFDPGHLVRRAVLVVGMLVGATMVFRVGSAMLVAGLEQAPDLAIPTVTPYLPVFLLSLFAFVPRQRAIKAGLAFLIVTAVPALIFGLLRFEALASSPRFVDLLQTLLIANPITFVFLIIISNVHRQVDVLERQSQKARLPDAPSHAMDAPSLSLNRAAVRERLQQCLETAHQKGAELCIGLLEIASLGPVNPLDTYSSDSTVRQVVQSLRTELGEKAIIGRIAERRFLLIWPGKRMSEIAEDVEQAAETLNSRFRGASSGRFAAFGLAAYRPGEQAIGLVQRADDQLRRALANAGVGIDFDVMDMY